MFRTLIYPSSGACDYSVELPHWSFCSCFDVCWSFGVVGLEWCPCCRLKRASLWQLKNKRPTWCHLLFYFTSYPLNMFRTLIYPSSGAWNYSVELPHWSCFSCFDMCWSFGVVGLEWYPCCRFLCAQHVSDINISIIRSLRLFCWINTLVVLFLFRYVLEFRCGWVGVVSVLQVFMCSTCFRH